jgi:ribosomal protein L39E
MPYLDHQSIDIIVKDRQNQALEWAATQRMLRQLQTNERVPAWCMTLRLLSRLGNRLVRVGQRLERLDMPSIAATMDQSSTCQGSTQC